MNILVLVGSLRAASVNRKLAEEAIAELPDGATATIYDKIGDLPYYNEELDGDNAPQIIRDFRAELAATDALIVVTPEYNGSLPGSLKNAIDWASRPRGAAPVGGKPAVILGASVSPNAALWAREDAVRILKVVGMQPIETTFGIGKIAGLVEGLALLDDAQRAEVRQLVGELVAVPAK